MRKGKWLTLSLTLIFLSSIGCIAQHRFFESDNPAKILLSKLELIAGPGLLLDYGNVTDAQNRVLKMGYAYGLGLKFDLNRKFAMGVRYLVEKNGHKTSQRLNANFGVDEMDIIDQIRKYNTLSTQLNYYLNRKHNFKAGAGCYYGSLNDLIESETVLINGQVDFQNTSNGKNSVLVENYDWGSMVSLSYNFTLSTKTIVSVELADKLGFVRIFKDNSAANTAIVTYPLSPKPHVIYLLISLSINGKSKQ